MTHQGLYLYVAVLLIGALTVLAAALRVVKCCVTLFKLRRERRASLTLEAHDALVPLPAASAWGLLRTADGQLKSTRRALATPGWVPSQRRRGGAALN